MQLFLLTATAFGLTVSGLSLRLFFGKDILYKGACGRLKLPGLVEEHEKCGSCADEAEEVEFLEV